MKIFIDRFAYVCHRPCYFGKVTTSIVTYSFARSDGVVEFLDILTGSLGFNVVKGACFNFNEPRTEKDRQKTDKKWVRQAAQFYTRLLEPSYPDPRLTRLMIFRMFRSMIRQGADNSTRDDKYYSEKGWLESDYSYPTRLGLLNKTAGKIFCTMDARRDLA